MSVGLSKKGPTAPAAEAQSGSERGEHVSPQPQSWEEGPGVELGAD